MNDDKIEKAIQATPNLVNPEFYKPVMNNHNENNPRASAPATPQHSSLPTPVSRESYADVLVRLFEVEQQRDAARVQADKLAADLRELKKQIREHHLLDVKKRFSLCAADAQAGTTLATYDADKVK